MKTRNLTLTAMAMLLSFAAMATRIPVLSINTDEPENAIVKIESFTPRNFELSLTDNDGQIIYYKKSERPIHNYSSSVNFNEIDDGIYHLSIDFGDCSINRDILVANHKVQSGEISKKCVPYFQVDKRRINISHFNGEQKNLFLNVYKDGTHIDGMSLGKELCIQKRVDISKLKRGSYEFVLSDNLNHSCAFTFKK